MKVLIIAMLLLSIVSGCVEQKPEPSAQATPTETPMENDEFGIESDLEQIDAMLNDSSFDISLEVNVSTFT